MDIKKSKIEITGDILHFLPDNKFEFYLFGHGRMKNKLLILNWWKTMGAYFPIFLDKIEVQKLIDYLNSIILKMDVDNEK